MKRLGVTVAAIALILAGPAANGIAGAEQSQEQSAEKIAVSKVRVGIFDSRALALVYYRSEAFRRHMDALKVEYEGAKAARNKKRVKLLEAQASSPLWPDSGWPPSAAQQDLIHKQVFGTWPVDNVLEKIEGVLPEVAIQAGVEVILSEWDMVYKGPEVIFVDVTDLMIRPFGPDFETLKLVRESRAQDPVPLEELGEHDH